MDRRANIATGLVTVLIGTAALAKAIADLSFFGPSGEPGPGLFPGVLAGALAVLGLALVGVESRKHSSSVAARGVADDVRQRWARALLVLAGVGVSIPIMQLLGFLVAMVVLAGFLIVVVERRTSASALATVGLMPGLIYVVFDVLLNVDLPAGIFAA